MSVGQSEMKSKVPLLISVSDLSKSLVKRVYRIGLMLLIPVLVFDTVYLWHSDFLLAISVPTSALLILCFGANKRLRTASQAWILAGVMFSVGLFNLFLFGWISDARLFLLTSMFVAALLIDKRAGYIFWISGILLTICYLLMSNIGWLSAIQGRMINLYEMRILFEWLVFVIFGGGLVFAVGFWLLKLTKAINEIKINRDDVREQQVTIENKINGVDELTKTLDKRKAILTATAAVTGSLTVGLPIQACLTLTVDLISQHFGFEHAGIYLMDESEKWLKLRAASSEAGKNLLTQDFQLPVDETSIIGWVAVNHQCKVFDFEKDDILTQDNYGCTALRAEFALPIIFSDELLGVLDLQSADPTAFDDYTVQTLRWLVSELALVFSTAQRLDNVPTLDFISPFYSAGYRIASAQSESAVYAAILEILCNFNPSRLTFFRKKENSGELYTVFDSINGKSSFVRETVGDIDNPLLSKLAQYGINHLEPEWLEKNKLHVGEVTEQFHNLMQNEQVSWAGINPIVIDNQMYGIVISLFDVPHQLNQVEMRLHRMVVKLAGMAFERNMLRDALKLRSQQSATLDGIRSEFRMTVSPDTILRTTLRELGQLLGAEVAQVQVAISDKGGN